MFNNMKIANKIWLNTFVALAAFILVESIYLMDIQSLATIRSKCLKYMKDTAVVSAGSHLGADLYQVIADAVINRNLDNTERDWSEGKIAAANILERMSEIADTAEQKAWVVASKQAYDRLVELFEKEAFPLLKRTTTDWVAVSMIDAKIDRQAEIIKINLSQLAASILKDEKKYNEDLDEAKGVIIQRNLFIGAASLFIILMFSFWVIRSIQSP